MRARFCLLIAVVVMIASPAFAKPKTRVYTTAPDKVFQSAMRVISEHYVVQYVDKDEQLISFQSGGSPLSSGFNCNIRISPDKKNSASTLATLNVQKKDSGDIAFNAGDRLADNLFQWIQQDLDGKQPQQSGK